MINSIENLMVMNHHRGCGFSSGTAGEVFGADAARLEMGEPQGEDWHRGAYDWWPLLLDGQVIGEVRDDACGITIHLALAD